MPFNIIYIRDIVNYMYFRVGAKVGSITKHELWFSSHVLQSSVLLSHVIDVTNAPVLNWPKHAECPEGYIFRAVLETYVDTLRIFAESTPSHSYCEPSYCIRRF
jgi:hypothetical protein